MKNSHAFIFVIAAVGFIVASQSVFTVDQREQAILLQLGQPVGTIMQPGLHLKIPLVQDVRRFDRRILSVDPRPEQMVISSNREAAPAVAAVPGTTAPAVVAEDESGASGEPIIVDTFARYRITDPLKFMKSLRTVDTANQRLESILNDATRTVLGKTTLNGLLSPERAAVMDEIGKRVNDKTNEDQLGIEIIDVRIVRADLTPDLRQSTVRRMISELKERATETRAKGEQRALEIRSTADKERSVLLAEAHRDADITRGEGDKEAILIYSKAYDQDKDFYKFYRTMEAYKNTLATPDTRLILSPQVDFLKYLKDAP